MSGRVALGRKWHFIKLKTTFRTRKSFENYFKNILSVILRKFEDFWPFQVLKYNVIKSKVEIRSLTFCDLRKEFWKLISFEIYPEVVKRCWMIWSKLPSELSSDLQKSFWYPSIVPSPTVGIFKPSSIPRDRTNSHLRRKKILENC